MNEPTYYMTSARNCEVGKWLPCKAQTLRGAKRECTNQFGHGFVDATLCIGTGDNVTRQRQIICVRHVWDDRWFATAWLLAI